jgi:putative transposase
VGRDALQRLLKLWGLQLRRKIRKPKISLIKKILILLADRTNLLIRTNIVRPLQAITGDITEIWYDNFKKKAYLCVHKDVFGQLAYGWGLSQRMTEDLAIASFERAAKNVKKLARKLRLAASRILCHQDRGSQFTGYEFVDNVLKNDFVLSYSSPGTPTENPGQESFFGRFKEENQDEFNEIKDFKTLERFIKKQINDYNRGRLHTSLGNQTPAEFTKNFFKKNSLKQPKNWFSIFRT